MNYINDKLKMLNDIQSEHTRFCAKSSRTLIYSIVGSVWGLLIGNNSQINFFLEAHRQMMVF